MDGGKTRERRAADQASESVSGEAFPAPLLAMLQERFGNRLVTAALAGQGDALGELLGAVLSAEISGRGALGAEMLSNPAIQRAQSKGLPATREQALERHNTLVGRVRHVMATALSLQIPAGESTASRSVLLRNSAEIIESGRVEMQVRSVTHDSEQRSPPPGKVAYFDSRVPWDRDGAIYETGEPGGVEFDFPEGGHYDPTTDTLVIAGFGEQSEDSIVETLLHEVQHLVDRGPDGEWEQDPEVGRGRYTAPPWAYECYASEYRARMVDGKLGSSNENKILKIGLRASRDPTDPEVASGRARAVESVLLVLHHEQQSSVFLDMVRDTSIERWYDYQTGSWLVMYGYLPHYAVLDPQFLSFIESYGATEEPSGGNLVNSVRIAELADLLHANAPLSRLLQAAIALDDVDRQFLRDVALSAPFWELAAARLLPARRADYAELQRVVSQDAGLEPGLYEYVVVEGDTLESISEMLYGDPHQAQEIARVNPDIEPEDLVPGTCLKVPARPGGVHAILPSSREEALEQHAALVDRVRHFMDMVLSVELSAGEDSATRMVLLRNSAELVESGRVGLEVRSVTHDSEWRDPPPGQVAYFDSRVPWDRGGATYETGEPGGVEFGPKASSYYDTQRNTIVFAQSDVNEDLFPDTLAYFLITEAQRAVSGGTRGPGADGPEQYVAPPWAYGEYAAEYRALLTDPASMSEIYEETELKMSAHRDPEDPGVVAGQLPLEESVALSPPLAEQNGVVGLIEALTGWDPLYDYDREGWSSRWSYVPYYCVFDPKFRAFVMDYGHTIPVADENPVNSVRIADLADALRANASQLALLQAAEVLDDVDRHTLRDPELSEGFWELATRQLCPERADDLRMLEAELSRDLGPEPELHQYVVFEGDTLFSIAQFLYGEPAKWREIARLNPKTDPNRLRPGEVLRVP